MNELLEKISREEPRNFSFAVNRAAPNDPYHDVKQQPVIPRNLKTLSAGKEKNLELLRQQAWHWLRSFKRKNAHPIFMVISVPYLVFQLLMDLSEPKESLSFDNMVYYVTLYSHHYLKEVTINHLLVIVLQAQWQNCRFCLVWCNCQGRKEKKAYCLHIHYYRLFHFPFGMILV